MAIADFFGLESLGAWVKEFMAGILPDYLDWIVPEIPVGSLSRIYVISDTTVDIIFSAGVATGLIVVFLMWSVRKGLSKDARA